MNVLQVLILLLLEYRRPEAAIVFGDTRYQSFHDTLLKVRLVLLRF